MNIDGVEYALVPKVATDEMVCAGYPHRMVSTRAAINAAIAAAPQPRVAVTDEAAKNIGRELWIKEREAVYPGLVNLERGRLAIAAVQSELGPALGMTAWREPTPEECVKMCSILTDWEVRRNDGFSLSPQGITQAQEAHGRAIFEAVREVMGGGE